MNYLPVALMDEVMMPVTEKDEIVEVGCPAMDPVHNVMRGAPRSRPVASRPTAVTVARLQRPAPGLRHDALGAPDPRRAYRPGL
jgi:hypothetical protein